MAQIIKHRRGNLEGLSSATTRAGELLVVTGSSGLGTIANGDSLVFVGIDGSTATPVNKILQGTTVPNLSGADYNTHVDGIPFFDTDNNKLYILNKGGNVEVSAEAASGTVSGSSQVVLQSADKTGFTGASSITTLGTITAGVWNGTAIANANLANDGITIDGADISLGGSVTTLQLGSTSSTALAGDTTTISGAQASAITANTAKISYNSAASTKLGTIEESADVTDTANVTAAGALMDSEITNLAAVKAFDGSDYLASSTTTISGAQASAITANTAKTGITSGQASAITANTAKVSATSSNVVSALSNQATDFGTGRVSGDDFGNVAGDSTFTGSFVGDGSGLTGLATNLTVNTADVDLLADDLDIVGTANEIEVATAKVGNDVTVTIGIPTNPTLSGNVTVTGNLNVEGTTTTIDSTTVNIGDRVLELNYARGAGDAGLLVSDVDGGSTVSGSLLWDASSDYWMAGKLGSEKEIALLNASPTANTVLKADSNGLLVDSLITDDGTDVTIGGTAELRINAATANSFVYFDSNKSIESVAASTAGDVIQWNGSSFVASNEIDGGTF